MSAQPVGLEVGERPDHAERGVDLVAGHPPLGRRLGGDRLLPDQRVVEPVEQLVEVVGREGGQVRVVGAARALLDHVARPIGARGRQEDRDVARDMEHPRRRRDRLPRGRAWEPVPVPALEDVRQVRDNAGAEAEPAGEALRDLAVQGERRARDLERVLERVGDHRLTNLRRSSLSHHVHEERADLFGVASVDECELGARLDVVPEELRLLGRVRRAAERVQQGDVVGVHELRRRELRELAEADREDRRPERVLERLTGAQIGRDRHRADHLRGADGRLAPRRSRCGRAAAVGCHG